MRIISAFLLSLMCISGVFAQSTIHSVKSDNWSNNDSWDLKRQPREGDVIVIAAGNIVEIDVFTSLSNVVIRVYGTLMIRSNKELILNKSSVVNILSGGKLSSESQSGFSSVSIDGSVKYRGTKIFNPSWGAGVVLGLASASHSTGDVDFGGLGFILGSLPIVWQDFNVFKTHDNRVKMLWVTSHETGSRLFEIQRGADPHSFMTIGSLKSSGNLGSQNVYSFIDDFPGTGTLFYRIKHMDADGVYKFSSVRLVKLNAGSFSYLVYPNPAKNVVTICFSTELKEPLQILLYRQNGQLVKKTVASTGMNRCFLDISGEVAGLYYIQMPHPDGNQETLPLTKY
jgi:Secretion system C-terminal sorting domain